MQGLFSSIDFWNYYFRSSSHVLNVAETWLALRIREVWVSNTGYENDSVLFCFVFAQIPSQKNRAAIPKPNPRFKHTFCIPKLTHIYGLCYAFLSLGWLQKETKHRAMWTQSVTGMPYITLR